MDGWGLDDSMEIYGWYLYLYNNRFLCAIQTSCPKGCVNQKKRKWETNFGLLKG